MLNQSINIMKNFSKNELVVDVMNLNQIINFINKKNCYDKVVEFFQITSRLQDHAKEIREFLPPMDGFSFCGIKSCRRKEREAKRTESEMGFKVFMSEINKAGRDMFGHNRTEYGEHVSKDNIYFGDVAGIWTFSIAEFENRCKNDAYVQEHIRRQITEFVKSYQGSFNLDWIA